MLVFCRLFSDVTFQERDRPQFRIPSKLKEPLKAAKSEVEKRLQEDSRVVSTLSIQLSEGVIVCSQALGKINSFFYF